MNEERQNELLEIARNISNKIGEVCVDMCYEQAGEIDGNESEKGFVNSMALTNTTLSLLDSLMTGIKENISDPDEYNIFSKYIKKQMDNLWKDHIAEEF